VKNKKWIMVSIYLIALVLVMAGCSATGRVQENSESPEYLISLGERFLLEQNYEQALVQFHRVIEIEPMEPRGYTGAAEAYIGLEQPDYAVAILQLGYERTGNTGIQQRLSSVIATLPAPDATTPSYPNDDAETTTTTEEPSDNELGQNNAYDFADTWETFTDELRGMLSRLDIAVETFDYTTAFEIMSSSEFNEAMPWRELFPGYIVTWHNEEFHWHVFQQPQQGAQEGGTVAITTWGRGISSGTGVRLMAYIAPFAEYYIYIGHTTIVDGIANGAFYSSSYNTVYHQWTRTHGYAVDGYRHGTVIQTVLVEFLECEPCVFVFQYEYGFVVNYIWRYDMRVYGIRVIECEGCGGPLHYGHMYQPRQP